MLDGVLVCNFWNLRYYDLEGLYSFTHFEEINIEVLEQTLR